MPAAPPAPPPATPPASVGSVAPPSSGEIHVTPPASGTELNPTLPPPKPGSAKSQMFSNMRAKAGVPETPTTPPAGKPKGQATSPAAETPPATDPNAPAPEAPSDTPPAAPTVPTTPEDRKKVSPWKLVDQFKERATKAEARALELEKQVLPEAKRKESEERLTQYEKQIQEMRDDLRYFNAEKYDPDIIKAQSEYEGSWKRALAELSEISVVDAASGQPRAVNANDLLDLVNMPLGKAREVANAAFGDFADDVMAHRKEIKTLFEVKSAKLEELKKNGAERDKQRAEQHKKLNGELSGHIKTAWDKEVASVLAHEKHGKFFKPREGDADWNAKLERGYKLVDDAYARNVADPSLTPQERESLVKKAVAVRNRAAAFEALRLDYDRTAAKLAKVEKDLAGYQGSTPGAGGTIPPSSVPASGGAFNQFRDRLRKLAK
jgi:hypothetical protein